MLIPRMQMRFNHTIGRSRNREWAPNARYWKIALVLLTAVVAVSVTGNTRAISVLEAAQDADRSASNPAGMFKQYCFQCHGATAPKAGVSLERLSAQGLVGENYQSLMDLMGVQLDRFGDTDRRLSGLLVS